MRVVREGLETFLIGLVAVVVLARLLTIDFQYIIWSDRDLYRSAAVFVDWPTSGAEMNYGVGARVPGGFYHWLLALPLALRHEPLDAYGLLVLLDLGAMGLLAWTARRHHGATAGVAVAAAWLLSCPARIPMRWLWNPTALPLFVVVGLWGLHDALTTDRRRGWWIWPAALALGGHAHMTSVTWLASTVAGAAVLRRDAFRRRLPLVATAVGVPYVPYLVREAFTGWPNTRALLNQRPAFGEARGGARFSFEELVQGAGYLVPDAQHDTPGIAVVAGLGAAAVVSLAAGGALLALSRGRRAPPAWQAAQVVVLGALVGLVLPAAGRAVHVEWRYLLATVPAFVWLVGVGVGALRARSELGGTLALVGLALALGTQAAVELPQRLRQVREPHLEGFVSYRGRRAMFEALRVETGRDAAGIAGRLALVRPGEGGGWSLSEPLPDDFRLRVEGQRFPGSLPPPCLAVFKVADGAVPGRDDLAALFDLPATQVRVLGSAELPASLRLLTYDPGNGHCPTSATDRYVFTDVEEILRPLYEVLEDGEVRALPLEGGHRVAVAVDAPSWEDLPSARTLLAIDLVPAPGGLSVTLHSNQLRGPMYNAGWFRPGVLRRPTVVLSGPSGEVEVPVHDGVVGMSFVVPPLSTARAVPAGIWSVRLRADVVATEGRQRPAPVDTGPSRGVDLLLLERLVVPAGAAGE